MLRALRRVANLTLLEQAILLQFIAFSLCLKVALSVVSLPRLVSFLSGTRSHRVRKLVVFLQEDSEPAQLFPLIDLATRVSHGVGRCLPRSLLLFWLLHANHRSVSVCLGVCKSLTALEAHAWVEQDGVVLGETVSFIERFTPVLRLPA
ncbi:hypothetical protein YTPLAS72_17580 [Nitrospira sp.]|nr:hypothetical protein YTPLAS72_17580 [Nitrospira sp.]